MAVVRYLSVAERANPRWRPKQHAGPAPADVSGGFPRCGSARGSTAEVGRSPRGYGDLLPVAPRWHARWAMSDRRSARVSVTRPRGTAIRQPDPRPAPATEEPPRWPPCPLAGRGAVRPPARRRGVHRRGGRGPGSQQGLRVAALGPGDAGRQDSQPGPSARLDGRLFASVVVRFLHVFRAPFNAASGSYCVAVPTARPRGSSAGSWSRRGRNGRRRSPWQRPRRRSGW